MQPYKPFQSLFQHFSIGAIATGCFILAAIGSLLLSLLGYLGEVYWLFDLASHFKLQYLVIGFTSLIFLGFQRQQPFRTSLVVLCLLCVSLNLVEVGRWYLPERSPPTTDASRLKVLLSNVKVQNQDYDKAIAFVREIKPDIAVFIETNEIWLQQLTAIQDLLPYRFTEPRDSHFGIVLYSAMPLENSTSRIFATERDSSLLADITLAGKTISLIATHPVLPSSAANSSLRDQQLMAIGQYAKELKHPAIVLGDLNISLWSPVYQRFMQISGLRDSRQGFGILPTWSTRLPFFYIPIDHCAVSHDFQVLKTYTGKQIGSDHLPLIVNLAL